MLLAYVIALIIYTLVSCHLAWALLRLKPIAKGFTLGMLLVALVAHAIVLYPNIFTLHGLNFNVFNTASLISFYFVLAVGGLCVLLRGFTEKKKEKAAADT